MHCLRRVNICTDHFVIATKGLTWHAELASDKQSNVIVHVLFNALYCFEFMTMLITSNNPYLNQSCSFFISSLVQCVERETSADTVYGRAIASSALGIVSTRQRTKTC